MQSMQSYAQGTQPYDNSRGVYNGSAAQQSPYSSNTSPQDRNSYGQTNAYMRGDMAPPTGRSAAPGEQDVKPPNGMIHPGQPGDHVSHQAGEDEAEHEAEYTHDSGAYDANRTAYHYNAPSVAQIATDHSNIAPEMHGSPSHQAGSGRATPRTAAPPQPYYSQQQGYSTPPRGQPSSSNLYNVMSNDRGSANGAQTGDVYGSQNDLGGPLQNGYPSQPVLNGGSGLKRGRDDEDELPRPSSGGMDPKRRKMIDAPLSAPTYEINRPQSSIAQRRR